MWLIGIINKYGKCNKEGQKGGRRDSPPIPTPSLLSFQSYGLRIWNRRNSLSSPSNSDTWHASLCSFETCLCVSARKRKERNRWREEPERQMKREARIWGAGSSKPEAPKCPSETHWMLISEVFTNPQWNDIFKSNAVAFPLSQNAPQFLKILESSFTQSEC